MPAKYRCAATGATWSGRGLKPTWLRVALDGGKQLADFEITAQA
jgi:DNA-binding protein H-NS